MQEKIGTSLAYFATAQLVEYGQNSCLLVLAAGPWPTDESISKSFRVCRCDKMLICQNFHSWVCRTEEQKRKAHLFLKKVEGLSSGTGQVELCSG